jgi:glucose-1-phosphate thymidylyltransferase
VGVEAGEQMSGSRIVGPVIIGTGTRVSGSHVGPFTSMVQDCAITGSEIEYSIVLRGALIQGSGGSRRR